MKFMELIGVLVIAIIVSIGVGTIVAFAVDRRFRHEVIKLFKERF